MDVADKRHVDVAERLLAYLRTELDNSDANFSVPLTPMLGGYEASTYHFKLEHVRATLAKPLVLRLYPEYRDPDHAIMEASVQNVLADKGYPVPSVPFTCTDKTRLGGAFLIMDFLPGDSMMDSAGSDMPSLLARTHAALHNIEPQPLMDSLKARGFVEQRFRFGGRLSWAISRAKDLPWLKDSVDWLIGNRPSEPDRLSICHGDFHPLNILVRDGEITAVLDWGGFMIGDAIMDVAKTHVICNNVARHLLVRDDWEEITSKYLAAYRTERRIDQDALDYYRLCNCVTALIDGVNGQESLTSPVILKSLSDLIYDISGIRVVSP